jgi:hypothetical protein
MMRKIDMNHRAIDEKVRIADDEISYPKESSPIGMIRLKSLAVRRRNHPFGERSNRERNAAS